MVRQAKGPYEGGDFIRTTVGNCDVSTAVSAGAIVNFQAYSGGKEESPIIALHTSAGVGSGWLMWIYEGVLAVYNGVSIRKSTIAVGPTDGACYYGFSHPAGTSKILFLRYSFAKAEWTVNEPASTLGNATAIPAGSVRFNEWQGKEMSEKQYVCAGIWGVALTEAQHKELIAVAALEEWKSKNSPKGLWLFNQSSVEEPLLDLTGGGADQSAISGTTVAAGVEPPIPYLLAKASGPRPGSLSLLGVGR